MDVSVEVELSYEGKKSALEVLDTRQADVSLLWQALPTTNRLYYGDNLPILANLLSDESVRGKVRLIYIDPPYATRGVFQTRSQKDAYSDLLEGSHYIEFIRERLILLRELLAPDGSIYVHLDENMAFYIKVVMDEVYGRHNFRNWITRKKCNPKNYTRKTYGDISDYILFYTKSDEYVWNRAYDKWTDEKALKEYSYVDEETGRRYKKVPVHAPGTRNGETGKMWRGMMPPPGKHWQYTPETLDAMDARGEIFWSSNGNPRRKVYLDESDGIPAQDIWLGFKDAHNQNIEITGYPTEKNPDLLKRIIEASSNPGDLVMDCFSGSGTTLEAASQLNRQWIGVDNSQEALLLLLSVLRMGLNRWGILSAIKIKR
ncbi:MAG: site-specific DNA-methyltransferase [Chloroflexota bacterium]